jgi:putative PIN family toxin of toxin-antitoxin system
VRVVFDTNIYISAFAIPGGNAEEPYLKAIQGECELFTSVAILAETARVLQMKCDWAEDKTRHAIQEINQTATVLRPRPTLHIVRDKRDNRILQCAMAAQADWIVSGDRHLLALKRHQGSTIISLAGFLADLQK